MLKFINQNRFTITACAAVLLCFVTITSLLLSLYDETSKRAITLGENISHTAGNRVNEYLRDDARIVALLCASLENRLGANGTPEAMRALLRQADSGYRSQFSRKFTGFFGYYKGSYVDSTNFVPPPKYVPKERIWYKKALAANGEVAVSPPYIDVDTGLPVVSLSKLLSDGESVIATDVILDRLDELVDSIKADGQGDCLIVDEEGTIVASTKGNKGQNHLRGDGSKEAQEMAKKIYEVKASSFRMAHVDGKQLVFVNRLYGNWVCITLIDESVLFAGIYKTMLRNGIGALLILILLVMLVYYAYTKRKQAQASDDYLRSIAGIYSAMAVFNLRDDTHRNIKSLPYLTEKIEVSSEKASVAIVEVIATGAEQNYRDNLMEFIDFSTLAHRLHSEMTITHDYIDKTLGWCRARFAVIDRDNSGTPLNVLFALEDINAAKREEERLIAESRIDKLTGALNRKAYEEKFAELESKPLTDRFVYISCDINGLKNVNDTKGHVAGDELIVKASEVLHDVFSTYGNIYRAGGDEFFLFLQVEPYKLPALVKDLLDTAEKRKGEYIDGVSLSVGYVAHAENPELSLKELAHEADLRMYESKAAYYKKRGIERRSR